MLYVETAFGAPVITNASGTPLFTGVVSNGVAVFDFNAINIASGSGLLINGVAPFLGPYAAYGASLPVALLSQTDINVAGGITVAPTAVGGPGAGQGGQTASFYPGIFDSGGSGGGGFGTSGSAGQLLGQLPTMVALGGAGGGTYGDLTKQLQMGSQGATGPGTFSTNLGQAQNFGGGAIELGANGTLNVTGGISAVGGSDVGLFLGGAGGGGDGAGGGSGGAILLHANTVNVANPANLDVSGGLGSEGGFLGESGWAAGGSGGNGRITIVSAAAVPEPSSLVLSTVATLAGLGLAWRRRVKA